MAMFRQHISVGAVLATAGVILVLFYGLITDPILLAVLFIVCAVGSILPDVDSDSGLPFYLMFGAATLAFAGAALYYELAKQPANNYILVGVPLVALVFFWFVVGSVFKHCTHHRGIWHSIPALAIAATATYIVSFYLGMPQQTALIFAAAAAAGFLSHLVLDEIYSEVNMDGSLFVPKRSLGTAVKLFSDSHKVNVLTYLLLFGLVYMALHPVTM